MSEKILLVYGGRSAEHEVSIRSAKNILQALNENKYDVKIVHISKKGAWYLVPTVLDEPSTYPQVLLGEENGKCFLFNMKSAEKISIDVAFPVLHGTFGEDGCIQGCFKMRNLPFVGCGVMSSALGMDKEFMKRVLRDSGLPVGHFLVLHKNETVRYTDIIKALGSPFFIKPANAGSSVGVFKIKNEKDFEEKLLESFKFDVKVLAEEAIVGREIEVSVSGLNRSPRASLPGEVRPSHEFYSYEAKYIDESGASFQIPAQLPQELQKRFQDLAKKTFQALGCDGLARVDFFLRNESEILINEINTLPGFTSISMYPKMWEASGLKSMNLIRELVDLALQRHQRDESNLFNLV